MFIASLERNDIHAGHLQYDRYYLIFRSEQIFVQEQALNCVRSTVFLFVSIILISIYNNVLYKGMLRIFIIAFFSCY